MGVDVGDRQALLWQDPFPDDWNENIVTPVFAGDILDHRGRAQGDVRLPPRGGRLDLDATAGLAQPGRADYMSTPVADGEYVYGFSNRRKGQIVCLDRRTGAVKWASRRARGHERRAAERRPQPARAHDRR